MEGGTELTDAWAELQAALGFAVARVVDDPDPQNDREQADGHRYVVQMLSAISQNALLPADPDRPTFRPMIEATRHLGAAGPDIDYDVALIRPGKRYRITGTRGGASYVGICLYDNGDERGTTGLLGNIDVDTLTVGADGTFAYDFDSGGAARLIVRQYFHDRSTQPRGEWTITLLDEPTPPPSLPTTDTVGALLHNFAMQLRWNAMLNQLWGAEHRDTPNRFVRQSAAEIVAAIPNPDVTYAFGWWRIEAGEALVVDVVPPTDCPYWALQLLDRWFQSYPDRRTNLNDRQVVREADGTVQLVIAAEDPGHPNWIDTSGHRVGTMFVRWLHTTDAALPECGVVPLAEASRRA